MTGRKRRTKRILAFFGLALLIYLVFPIKAAVPLLHMSYRFPHPVAGVPYRGWNQLRHDKPAAAAFDAQGHFFMITVKDKVLHVAQWDIQHGRCIRAVPLHVEGGQPVVFDPDWKLAFSVSPSGKRWWLAFEHTEVPKVMVFDERGQILKRWLGNISTADFANSFQAVGETQVLLLDTLFNVWEMNIGPDTPRIRPIPEGSSVIEPDGSITLISPAGYPDNRRRIDRVDMKGAVSTITFLRCFDGLAFEPFTGERRDMVYVYGNENVTTPSLVSLVEHLPLVDLRRKLLRKLVSDCPKAYAVDSSGKTRLLVAYPGVGQFFKCEKNGTVWFNQDLATTYDHEYLLLKTVRWPRSLVWWRWLQVRRAMERRPVDWERYKAG